MPQRGHDPAEPPSRRAGVLVGCAVWALGCGASVVGSHAPNSREAASSEAFDAFASELESTCRPRPVGAESLADVLEEHRAGNACLARRLAAEAPAAAASRTSLAGETGAFDAFRGAFATLVEQLQPLDVLEAGFRTSDALGCETAALEERISYARWLRAGDARALAARAAVVGQGGPKTRAAFARIVADDQLYRTLHPNDLALQRSSAKLVGIVTELERSAGELASSSCATFPGLAAALGGAAACGAQLTGYYLGHCRVPVAG